MEIPNYIPSPDLKKLIAPLEEIGFSIAEPIYSEPSWGHYLAVLKSSKLYVKLSKDRSGPNFWVKSAETPDSSEWRDVAQIRWLVLEQQNNRRNLPMSFTSIQDAISYFAREYDSIVNVFRSHSAAMIANRIKQIEAEERSAALRAIGIKYKKL